MAYSLAARSFVDGRLEILDEDIVLTTISILGLAFFILYSELSDGSGFWTSNKMTNLKGRAKKGGSCRIQHKNYSNSITKSLHCLKAFVFLAFSRIAA